MGKRIIYCTDGTWDTSKNNTNVYKIYKASTNTADQIALYDDGVGSDGLPLERLVGGAFGTGIWQKIKDGYSKISHVYEQDDPIFIFGFSRGAYTARSIAGMISVCGLPTHDFDNDALEMAFTAYRNKAERADLLAKLQAKCGMYAAKITMVGVWDTVGSLGIPSLIGQVELLAYGFLDVGLNPNVQNAYHAIAIDERRCEFPATLWQGPFADHQTVEQVYFTGCHCDVGGGNPVDTDGSALSNVPLAWMMSKAAALGADFAPGCAFPADPKFALDSVNESWNVGWAFPVRRKIADGAWIANSVAIRFAEENSYRPSNLKFANNTLGDYVMVDVVKHPAALAMKAGQ